MKKLIKAISLIFVTMALLFSFNACSNDKVDKYVLTNICVYTNNTDGGESFSVETISEQYPQIINDLGTKLSIKNEYEIIFNGTQTKDFNGKITYSDAILITYINVENNQFYTTYENIYIMNELYIESRFISIEGKLLKFKFQFDKVK